MRSVISVSKTRCLLAAILLLAGSPRTFADQAAPNGFNEEIGKGKIAKGNSNYDEASAAFKRASDLAGGRSAEALVLLTDAYNKGGKHDLALQTGHQALAVAVDPALKSTAFSQIGVALAASNDKQKLGHAEQVFRNALELRQGKSDTVRENLAAVLRSLGRAKDADTVLAGIEKGDAHPMIDIDQGVVGKFEEPSRISGPNPVFPAEAAKNGVFGRLTLKATVDKKGDVVDVAVLEGLPHGVTEGGIAAIKQWKFKPASLAGTVVASYAEVTFVFQAHHG
jgi:TonB family protein